MGYIMEGVKGESVKDGEAVLLLINGSGPVVDNPPPPGGEGSIVSAAAFVGLVLLPVVVAG